MKRLLVLAACLALAVSFAACKGKKDSQPASNASGNAAMVNGSPITMAEVEGASRDAMQKLSGEIYKIQKRELDVLIEQKLIETAAAAQGKSADEYVKLEVEDKVTEPSDNEIKAMYEARKDQYKLPYDQVKGEISGFLKQNRQQRLYRNLVTKLRGESDVKVMLEPPRVKIDIAGVPFVGEEDAPITLVEFSDYQCPFCKRVRPTIWGLMEDYKGKIKYVFMDFPLSFHAKAQKAHEAARCAGDQDKYYDYNKKVFDNQNAIDVPDLKKYAKELNLDTAKFDKCLDGGQHAEFVKDQMQKGSAAGVSGTPAYFINGVMLSGARPQSAFVEIIDEELAR